MSELVDYKLADVGEGIAEAEIIEWLVKVGDIVVEDQPVVVVETDKSQIEIPSPVSGEVVAIDSAAGDVIAVGASLMKIQTGEGNGKPKANNDEVKAGVQPSAIEVNTNSAPAMTTSAPRVNNVRPLASPSTRRLAATLGVQLETVSGSGPNGRITEQDVKNSVGQSVDAIVSSSEPTTASASIQEDGVTVIPMRGLRRQIAASMTEALKIPHILEFKEIDATALLAARAELAPNYESAGKKLSITPFLMRACILALAKHKTFNARYDPDAGEVSQYDSVHLGFATATDDGLIVPVIRNADKLSVIELAEQTDYLANLAKTRKASPEQLSGGTFTITNFGSFGTWLGTPIIRSPEVGIAGFGRVSEKVIPVNGQPAVRNVLPIVVAVDHRVNDGAHEGAFMSDIAKLLLNPESLVN